LVLIKFSVLPDSNLKKKSPILKTRFDFSPTCYVWLKRQKRAASMLLFQFQGFNLKNGFSSSEDTPGIEPFGLWRALKSLPLEF